MTKYNNPVPTKCWEAYLKSLGCNYDREDGTHHHWKCPNCFGTITFWGHKKEIPRFHIRTNLRTLNKTNKQFNTWADSNC